MSLRLLTRFNKISDVKITSRCFSVSSSLNDKHNCKFLVVGGGTAGCATAAKLSKTFSPKDIIILEPNSLHYYQPLFTLVGAGVKVLKDSHRNMADTLPKGAKWLKDSAASFNPEENRVITKDGDIIQYEYMVLATGMQLNYDAIPGLVEALEDEIQPVCSIYSPKYVEKTWRCLQNLQKGEAAFTFPNSPVKCPGAPQKIMYLVEDFLKNNGHRDNVNITFNTSLGVIFGVKKYADALWKIVKQRNINVNLRTNLVEVRPQEGLAIFQNLDDSSKKFTFKYSFMHVTPPMGPLKALQSAASLVNPAGFVTVNRDTMQHTSFSNVFALGDCCDSPNSKTAAAVAAQSHVLSENLKSQVHKKPLMLKYDGYASCPLVTSYNKCILAEFDYDLQPTETFPVDQSKERYSMFLMKKDAMPLLYWNMMTKGYWNGPQMLRSVFKPFKSG